MKALLRGFSYLYHAVLALFLLAISLVALSSGQFLHLEMLPWQGGSLTYWLLFGSLAGLILLILSMLRKGPVLFFLWSVVVFVLMFRGFFFSAYHFAGEVEFHRALYLTGGAFLAILGAWFPVPRKARY